MKKQNSSSKMLATILMIGFSIFSLSSTFAQAININASVSNNQPLANKEITVTLDVTDDIDFYYGELEASFDTALMEFNAVDTAKLSKGGIYIDGEITPGTIGASVSLISPLDIPTGGAYMKLNFRVKETADTGSTTLSFANQKIYNSDGEEILTSDINDITLDIQGSIGYVDLTIPPENTVTEGGEFDVTASVFATGITDTSRIITWVGVNKSDSDPSSWVESSWLEMQYTGTDASNYLNYTHEIVTNYKRTEGTSYIALRTRLDNGEFVYGGSQGLWNADSSPSVLLDITRQPPYRHTLVEWNFDEETLYPSQTSPENQDAIMELTGASFGGYVSGASGRAANSKNWENGSDGSKYWSTFFSTSGFTEIQLSSKQSGSNTGPRDFTIETSTDGNTWTAVDKNEITVDNSWSSGVLDTLHLPSSIDDQKEIHIRWVMTSDTSVDNDDIGSSGTNRLDDVLITGINPSSNRIEVYPGDANHDSTVNAADVLPLGTHWLQRGPLPVYNSIEFAARKVEEWITASATHADTRGDGVVDHRDLMPIGLNYGKSILAKKKNNPPALTEMVVDPQSSGDFVTLSLEIPYPIELRGMAFNLSISGIGSGQWEIQNLTPEFCPDNWNNQLLSFNIKRKNTFEAAFVLKGTGDITRSKKLVTFDLKATDEWTHPVTVSINRVTISNTKSDERPADFPKLLPTGNQNVAVSYTTKLLQNRPNPCRYMTLIPYELSATTHVRLEILNLEGIIIEMPVDKIQSPGHYTISYDARDLPEGIYLYRLQTGKGYVKSKKMSVIK